MRSSILREETHRIPLTLPASSVLELGLDDANYSVNHREIYSSSCAVWMVTGDRQSVEDAQEHVVSLSLVFTIGFECS